MILQLKKQEKKSNGSKVFWILLCDVGKTNSETSPYVWKNVIAEFR